MAGVRSGVAKRVSEKEARAIYSHCYGHALNLACADQRCNWVTITDPDDH